MSGLAKGDKHPSHFHAPAVVVAAVLGPVLPHNLPHGLEGLGRVRVVVREDGKPGEHGPQPVLLPDVVAARAEGLLAAVCVWLDEVVEDQVGVRDRGGKGGGGVTKTSIRNARVLHTYQRMGT